MKKLWILVTALLLTTACLIEDKRHTFYLDPDGSVTWTVVQEEIRSDAGDKSGRIREEREFLESVARGRHPVARAFEQLGALRVDAKIVRAERPYTIVTEARFESIARVLEGFLDRVDLVAEAQLVVKDDLMRLTFSYREGEGDASGPDDDNPVENLIADHETYRFVLTEGKFLEAEGFRLESNDTAAVLLEVDENDNGTATHSLTWSR